MRMSIKEQALTSPYLQFDRNQWAALRDSVPMTLTEEEIARLKGINEDLSLEEVAEIYLPLAFAKLLHQFKPATSGSAGAIFRHEWRAYSLY
jgi:pantothenate kinase